jgi:hypothetical protein
LSDRQAKVASDHNQARLGKDGLQLGDQIGFLRTIHANSKVSTGTTPIELVQMPEGARAFRWRFVRGGRIESDETRAQMADARL